MMGTLPARPIRHTVIAGVIGGHAMTANQSPTALPPHILADNPNLPDGLVRMAAQVIEENPDLFDVVTLVRPTRRRMARKGVAA